MSEVERVNLADLWLSEDEPARSGTIEALWQWLANPAQADTERTLFASCGRPPDHEDGPQAGVHSGVLGVECVMRRVARGA